MDSVELIFAGAFILDLVIGYRVYTFIKDNVLKFLRPDG